jgi:catechol 2,3-dioxygenase-like lactoylglutathione lyase family enzyme
LSAGTLANQPVQPLVDALLGATVIVDDPQTAAFALESVLGMERRAEGRLDSGAHFVTVAAAGADRGMIRFAEGRSGADEALRQGWGSVEMVVRDVDGLAQRLKRSEHFRLRTSPVTFDLTDVGSNVHRAAMAWGPGNLLMGFTMAVTQPRGRRFTEVWNEVGPVFSVGLRTPDLDRTSMFYRAALGMETLLEVSWRSGQWHRMFGVPDGEEAALRLLKGAGPGTGLGTIEVQSFPITILQPAASPAIAWVTYHTRSVSLARTAAEGVCEIDQGHGTEFTMVGEMGERLEVTETAW